MKKEKPLQINCTNCPEGFYFTVFGRSWLLSNEEISLIVKNYIQLCADDLAACQGKEKLYLANGQQAINRLFMGPHQKEYEIAFLQPALLAHRHLWKPYTPDMKKIQAFQAKKKAEMPGEPEQPRGPKLVKP